MHLTKDNTNLNLVLASLCFSWVSCVLQRRETFYTCTCNLISCKFTVWNPTEVFSWELPPHLHIGFSNLLSSNPIEIHVPDTEVIHTEATFPAAIL